MTLYQRTPKTLHRRKRKGEADQEVHGAVSGPEEYVPTINIDPRPTTTKLPTDFLALCEHISIRNKMKVIEEYNYTTKKKQVHPEWEKRMDKIKIETRGKDKKKTKRWKNRRKNNSRRKKKEKVEKIKATIVCLELCPMVIEKHYH